jgi:hypothetical protein
MPIEHGLGRIPGVLFHRREPTTAILDGNHGSDIDSCHFGVGLLNVMIMRLAKAQGERQPVLTGPARDASRPAGDERRAPLALPPEVTASMLDMQDRSGPLPVAMKKDKIARRRRHLRHVLRAVHEHRDGTAASSTSSAARSSRRSAASAAGARSSTSEEIKLLDAKMHDGLDSPVAYLMRKDPDLSRGEALAKLKQNIDDWALVIAAVRALNIPGAGGVANPGQSPQVNGANNGASNPASGATTQYPATGQATAAKAGAAA